MTKAIMIRPIMPKIVMSDDVIASMSENEPDIGCQGSPVRIGLAGEGGGHKGQG